VSDRPIKNIGPITADNLRSELLPEVPSSGISLDFNNAFSLVINPPECAGKYYLNREYF
jgi:hypothetical protein